MQIVDGVRRVEAHALDDVAEGETASGLFGSYAVGAVRCDGARSWILDGDETLVAFRLLPADPEIIQGDTMTP